MEIRILLLFYYYMLVLLANVSDKYITQETCERAVNVSLERSEFFYDQESYGH